MAELKATTVEEGEVEEGVEEEKKMEAAVGGEGKTMKHLIHCNNKDERTKKSASHF